MKKIKLNLGDFIAIKEISPFLKDGIIISVILHMFFLILIMVSPYIRIHSFIPQVKYDEPIIVDLDNLIVGKETILPPAPSIQTKEKEEVKQKKTEYFKPEPVVKKEELPPPPQPKVSKQSKDDAGDFIDTANKKEEKTENTKEKNKDIVKERMGGLEDLLASVDGLKRNEKNIKKKELEKTKEIKNESETTNADFGTKSYQKNSATDFLKKQMAISYIDAIRIKLRSCWNFDAGAKDIQNMKIVIRTSLSPDGNMNSIEILNKSEYLTSPWFKAVAESAKRALIICSPYNLPVEFYQDWKDIVFTFYPDKKSVQ